MQAPCLQAGDWQAAKVGPLPPQLPSWDLAQTHWMYIPSLGGVLNGKFF